MSIFSEEKIYNRYFGDFRGVDFSNDHTQIADTRFAYAVNMYKDYQSAQGKCVETIPGFRRRAVIESGGAIRGVHRFKYRGDDGEFHQCVLIHAGDRLYYYSSYGICDSSNISCKTTVRLYLASGSDGDIKTFLGDTGISDRVSLSQFLPARQSGEALPPGTYSCVSDGGEYKLKAVGSDLCEGDYIQIEYCVAPPSYCYEGMADRESVSVVFNETLYVFDGTNFLCCYMEEGKPRVRDVSADAYVPTISLGWCDEGEDIEPECISYEQRNALTPRFYEKFKTNGIRKKFTLSQGNLDNLLSITLYGKSVDLSGDDCSVDLKYGTIEFNTPPPSPSQEGYDDYTYGLVIEASKTVSLGEYEFSDVLKSCTLATIFDNRLFLSGSPYYPNKIFWSELNTPRYFAEINTLDMGVGDSPVTGMIPVSDTLAVLKNDANGDSSVYFITPMDDSSGKRIYKSVPGLSGTGCIGPCTNFLDDPVFISKLGVEAIGQLSVRLERSIEHRSSLIDAVLTNTNLKSSHMIEWNGYLIILIDGKIFMADSRQRYTDDVGNVQYEWYYLEDVGIWDGQYTEYLYSTSMRSDMYGDDGKCKYAVKYCKGCFGSVLCNGEDYESVSIDTCTCKDKKGWIKVDLELSPSGGCVANPPNENGEGETLIRRFLIDTGDGYEFEVFYHVDENLSVSGEVLGYGAYLCNTRGNFTGGVFYPAVSLVELDGNLFFGTENGVLCSFNFDKRDTSGEIPKEYYSFDGRTIFCGCATKMDNCSLPHMMKNTIKKSTVIKTKTMQTSGAKVKVRTNRKPYEQIARISSGRFLFDNMDFSDFSFITTEHNLFAIREKEKKWVEKQYFFYSDEYLKPFSLFYAAYRYKVIGSYKETASSGT